MQLPRPSISLGISLSQLHVGSVEYSDFSWKSTLNKPFSKLASSLTYAECHRIYLADSINDVDVSGGKKSLVKMTVRPKPPIWNRESPLKPIIRMVNSIPKDPDALFGPPRNQVVGDTFCPLLGIIRTSWLKSDGVKDRSNAKMWSFRDKIQGCIHAPRMACPEKQIIQVYRWWVTVCISIGEEILGIWDSYEDGKR